MSTDRRVLAWEELDTFMQKVEKLRTQGMSDSQIASRLGVVRTTIVQRRRRWKIGCGLEQLHGHNNKKEE